MMARTERRNARVVIFGAGLGGVQLSIALLQLAGVEVVSFLDNDAARHGTQVLGIPVRGVDALPSIDYDCVIVASIHHAAIRAQLVQNHVPARRILVATPGMDARAQLRARGIETGPHLRLPEAPVLRVAVFGAGAAGLRAWESLTAHAGVEIVTFVDNDRQRWGTAFLGVPVVSPAEAARATVDFVLVASVHATAIIRQLLSLGVPAAQIATPAMLEWLLAARAQAANGDGRGWLEVAS
jgi:FlaA1/EpsC-like NDP-sugar epimerase